MSKSKRTQSFIQLGLIIGIAIFLNILGGIFNWSLDLTEENRYTLTDATREILKEVDEPIFVRILLEGEFPAGFKRLQRATREMLDDFRAKASSYEGDKGLFSFLMEEALLEYEFVDPNEGTMEEVNQRREELAKDGIVPALFRLKDVEGTEEKLIYPYAIFTHKGRQVVVNLLEDQIGMGQEEKLNNSINLLEYKFANAIQKLMMSSKPIIAFTKGHGELDPLQTRDLIGSLSAYYEFGRFDLDSNYQVPPQIDLLIVAKPTQPFSERDKFLIDQYVMNGGKVMWLIDKLNAELDSLRSRPFYVPMDYPLNLDDILFKYGVRIEPNLILDLQCSRIPQVIGMQAGNPQVELFPWYYHPIVTPRADHPIVKSLGNVNLFFPSRIDTVRTRTNIQKTVLLSSSEYSREQYTPVRLDFEILRYEPDPSKFKKSNLPMAVLLEGVFPSHYQNRLTENMKAGLTQIGAEFKQESVPNRMLVVADGDIAANPVVNPETKGILPLGYNRFERQLFANKDFVINGIEFLLNDEGVIEARGKEIKLRLLDTVRAREQKTLWQLLNILVPLVFLGLFGFLFNYLRKRRYAN